VSGRARETHQSTRASRRRVLRRASALVLAWLAFALGSRVRAGDAQPDFRVICAPSRPETSVPRQFLADAFLKNVTRWPDDETIRPVDQKADSVARRRFSDSVLHRSVAAMKTYWQQRIFSGRGVPPPELDSDDAVVRYVEAHPGAVGYIAGSISTGKTKVLAIAP
jgi:ABC-type phosphate transport system substrate-binding protein